MPLLRLTPGSGSAFRYRPFRLYWTAQLVSMMGTFMQMVALGYLVYDLTGSKWLLGVISAVQMGPSLLLSLPAGVLADRVDRRRLIICTQTTALILAFCLATLTATHSLRVWQILVISTISGVAIAVESPARQAFVSNLVQRDTLANAIAWNSLVLNGARVLGPAVGGVAVRFVGEAPVFYYNSFSFLAMIVVLLLMRLSPTQPELHRHPVSALVEGLRYARRAPAIVVLLALTGLVATFIMNFSVLMPILAHDSLHVGAEGLGWLWTAFGLGAVAGSMTVVSWSRAAVRGPLLVFTALAAGVSTVCLALSTSAAASLAVLVVIGWSTGVFFACANSAIQHRVEDRMRGRVLSLYAMIFSGSTPLGGLLCGALASAGGASLALAATGGICFAGTVILVPVLLRQTRDTGTIGRGSPVAERAS